MAIETKLDLNEETIDHLQSLIRINIDSYEGFKESAEQIEDSDVAVVFHELAQERAQLAKELQIYCEWNGGRLGRKVLLRPPYIVPGLKFAV